jgi:hypothetical protein
MVKTEPTATPPIPSHPGDIDSHGEDALRELANKEERKREKRLRKEAARKQKRDKEKHRAKNDDISGSEPSDERISSPSHEQVSGLPISTTPDETPVRREIKKKKRSRVAVVDDEFDAQPPLSTDERTRKGSSNFSRKRRRRDRSP